MSKGGEFERMQKETGRCMLIFLQRLKKKRRKTSVGVIAIPAGIRTRCLPYTHHKCYRFNHTEANLVLFRFGGFKLPERCIISTIRFIQPAHPTVFEFATIMTGIAVSYGVPLRVIFSALVLRKYVPCTMEMTSLHASSLPAYCCLSPQPPPTYVNHLRILVAGEGQSPNIRVN